MMWTVGYFVFQVPVTLITKQFRPRPVIATLVSLWGLVCLCQGFVKNFHGIAATRYFLGMAESGVTPSLFYYMTLFYPRHAIIYRICFLFSAAALAGAFAGLAAYGIGFMRGDLNQAGWKWVFELEGGATLLVGIGAYFCLQMSAAKVRFLDDDERERLLEKLRRGGGDAAQDQKLNWSEVRAAFLDPSCWLYGLMGAGTSLPLSTVSVYLPSIIKGLGYTAANAQLMTAPLYAIATVLTMLASHLSFKQGLRWPYIVAGTILTVAGYTGLLISHTNTGQYVASGCVIAGLYPTIGIVLAWPAENLSGHTKRIVGGGIQMMCTHGLGTLIGVFVYRPKDGPRFVMGHIFSLGSLTIHGVCLALQVILLASRNARRAQLRAERDEQDSTAVVGSSQQSKSDVESQVKSSTYQTTSGVTEVGGGGGVGFEQQIEQDIGDHLIDWVYQL